VNRGRVTLCRFEEAGASPPNGSKRADCWMHSCYLLDADRTRRSTSLISFEGMTLSVAARLKMVRKDGLFSPRSSWLMYVRWYPLAWARVSCDKLHARRALWRTRPNAVSGLIGLVPRTNFGIRHNNFHFSDYCATDYSIQRSINCFTLDIRWKRD